MAGERREVSGREVELTNPDKVLYPADGLTKADVVDYFQRVAETMVPHLHGRPIALRRFPDGIEEDGFFQKEASEYFPDWIRTVEVPLRTESGTVRHVLCQDAATLVYLANQGCLEFHTWLSTTDDLDSPDRLVVDLDPADGVDIGDLRAIARELGNLMDSIDLAAFVQTTGGRGFHVLTPLDRSATYDEARELARQLAEEFAARDPERLTTEQRKDRRGRRVFLDIARNAYGQMSVAPYSLRARPGAPAATPIDWSELGRVEPQSYNAVNLPRRLANKDDPWTHVDTSAGTVGHAWERMELE